jgi:hypothetical protein
MDKKNMQERFNVVVHELIKQGLIKNVQELAIRLGTHQQNLSSTLNGKRGLSVTNMNNLCSLFPVSRDYMYDGVGKALRPMQAVTQSTARNGQQVVLGNGNNTGDITLSQCQQEVETLRARLKDKEDIIALLKEKLKQQSKKIT